MTLTRCTTAAEAPNPIILNHTGRWGME